MELQTIENIFCVANFSLLPYVTFNIFVFFFND